MSQRFIILICCATLLGGAAAGCGVMTPGNEGWFCKTSEDCKEGLRCRTYRHRGKSHTNRLCTGRKALTSTSQNYGWIILIAAWFFVVVAPIGLTIFVVVKRVRNKKQGPPQPPGQGSPPPPDGAPPPEQGSPV
ncbi:MAG: hypothetical protein ABI333_29215 [bacterium]